MKKTLSLLLATLLLLSLAACSPTDGCYYALNNGTLDEESFLELKGDTWRNHDNMEGRFQIEDGHITLYHVTNGVERTLLEGSIEGDVIVLQGFGMTTVFCKKGS